MTLKAFSFLCPPDLVKEVVFRLSAIDGVRITETGDALHVTKNDKNVMTAREGIQISGTCASDQEELITDILAKAKIAGHKKEAVIQFYDASSSASESIN